MATLTGKYLNGAKPEGARLTLYSRFQRYSAPHAQPVRVSPALAVTSVNVPSRLFL